ncbi:MAG: HEPN domain-containing protein [Candidatus Nanoarchaeia archaeon]|nr:HEPN domain-containing protein [Candidatus Nanoarchaeia archaeon]
MKSLDFLNKLKEEEKLELVECSEQMAISYEKKGIECREVAILAFNNDYFESAVTQSYYSMYNNVLSLFFKCGIKCENHSAAAILLKDFFNQKEFHSVFSKAKVERIDKQYYITPTKNNPATKESAKEMISIAMKFNPQIIAFKNNLKLEEIKKIREKIKQIEKKSNTLSCPKKSDS